MYRRDLQLRNRKGTKIDELRIQQHLGSPDTCWRYLGDYQYSPKLRVEREEADLDNRRGAATGAGLNPLVFPRATRSQSVRWKFTLGGKTSRGGNRRCGSMFTDAFSVAHTLKLCFMFSASVFSRYAAGRDAHAQSGRLPCGSLLTNQQRQSATRHRQMGRASYGARRAETALPSSPSIRQNIWKLTQGSAAMHKPNINIHRHFGVFSSALAPAQRLTRRSTGHQRAAHVAAG